MTTKTTKKATTKKATTKKATTKKATTKKAAPPPEELAVLSPHLFEPSAPPTATRQVVEIERIYPDPDNARRQMAGLADLAASIAEQGMMVLPEVRPVGDRYVVTHGHRRLAAAKLLGWSDIEVMIVDVSTLQAVERQLIENAQRLDLDPLEEAHAYHRLAQMIPAAEVGTRIKKSRTHVYDRLKLLELGEEGQAALRAGKISPSVAVLVARQKDQVAALKAVEPYDDDDHPLPYRDAVEALRHEKKAGALHVLRDAPFWGRDEIAPSCDGCPHRVGTEDGADVCTEAACYDAKVTEHKQNVRVAWEAAGASVLVGDDAVDFLRTWRPWEHGNTWVRATDRPREFDAGERTWWELVGLPEPLTAPPKAWNLFDCEAIRLVDAASFSGHPCHVREGWIVLFDLDRVDRLLEPEAAKALKRGIAAEKRRQRREEKAHAASKAEAAAEKRAAQAREAERLAALQRLAAHVVAAEQPGDLPPDLYWLLARHVDRAAMVVARDIRRWWAETMTGDAKTELMIESLTPRQALAYAATLAAAADGVGERWQAIIPPPPEESTTDES